MERGYFFDSTATEQKIYQAADFARFHAQIIGNGVSNTANLPDLTVSEKLNMTVLLGAGYAFANGYMYENTTALNLTHDVAEPTVDRIDRIIVRFDDTPGQRRTYALIRKGTADSLVPPAIVRDSYIFELSVAQVKIIAGKSFIEQTEILDERTDDTVCGYIPLHNIYRGLSIDKNGIVTLPNQSFVDYRENSTDGTPLYVIENTKMILPWGNEVADKQQEVVDGNKFVAKAPGVYTFWLLVRSDGYFGGDNVDMQVHFEKNGAQYPFPFIAGNPASRYDNMWIGTMIEELNPGDTVQFKVKNYVSTTHVNVINTWTRIAKIS